MSAALVIRAYHFLYRQRDLLADFEAELIAEVHGRVVHRGGVASEAELQVIRDALAAMEAAPMQDACEALAEREMAA